MSRAAPSKTRGADKTKPPASQTPVIAHEIVPGKFNENDWNIMVDRDGADEFVSDILDELMEKTMSAIYDKYIEKQLLPFTITQARDAITEIIEWQFLTRDEGEEQLETDLGWSQDEEAEPAVTDCWAQGAVPKNIIPPEEPLEEIPEEPEPGEETAAAEVELGKEPPELEDVVSETEYNATAPSDEQDSILEAMTRPKLPETVGLSRQIGSNRSRTTFKPYKGKLKSAGVRKMTESLEETEMKMMYDEMAASMPCSEDHPSTALNMPASCTSILKVQSGRPPGTKDVVYDEFGNVMAVMKLDPEKLPTHKVSVKYHVVDPAVEAAQARLDAMRKGKSTGKIKRQRSLKNVTASMESIATVSKVKPPGPTSTMAPLPPPLSEELQDDSELNETSGKIEEMEVSNGVIVREGGRVKKGPGRYYRKLDILEESQMGMAPVTLRLTNPGITVSDLLDRHTPILRPLSESTPLPPIVPQPNHQSQEAV